MTPRQFQEREEGRGGNSERMVKELSIYVSFGVNFIHIE